MSAQAWFSERFVSSTASGDARAIWFAMAITVCSSSALGTTRFTEPEPFHRGGVPDRLRPEELLGLSNTEFPRVPPKFGARGGEERHRMIKELGVVRGDDDVAHCGEG